MSNDGNGQRDNSNLQSFQKERKKEILQIVNPRLTSSGQKP